MFRAVPLLCALALLTAPCGAEPVWLVSNGFHTSIAVRRGDVPHELGQLVGDPGAEYLVFGWGAAIYYTARKVTPVICWRATCLPNASALHIVPVRGPLARRFARSDVFRFDVKPDGVRELSRFLRDAVKRDHSGAPVLIGAGYFAGSRFYAGREIFWFPLTCNIWSARALRRAGVPVRVWTAIAAPDLVWQSEKHGWREQSRRPPPDTF
jgi:uncharacterized protein (TIGR02117 family)